MSIAQEIRESFRYNDIIIKLIYINAAIFLVMRIADVAAIGGGVRPGWMMEYTAMPIGAEVIYKPWTIATNIFAHYELLHFIFNMLTLYWFGRMFMQTYGSERRALVAYVAGGLAGCAAAFLTSLIYANHSGILLGASAAIMCIMVAATVAAPDHRVWVTFFGEVKIKYVTLTYVLLSVIMLVGLSNVGGNLAHLGGALAGWALAKFWSGRRETDTSISSLFRRKPKMKLVRGGNPDWDFNKRKAEENREVDRILEKINARGYNSLTDQEKATLFDKSKQ